MKLSDEVYEFIKQEVIDLFIRYDIKCTPISGFELAQKMGIVVIPYSALSKRKLRKARKISPDGFYLEAGDGKEYIYYDDTSGYERSNMTILHEIGHCVLGHMEKNSAKTKNLLLAEQQKCYIKIPKFTSDMKSSLRG